MIQRLIAIQQELSSKVRIVPLGAEPRLVAGVDAWCHQRTIRAGVAVFSLPGKMLVYAEAAERDEEFPYVPCFLSFRELSAMTEAIRRLPEPPDLILVDGQGIAHPRGLGIASHLGVELGIPTIGCAKSRLVGEYEEPGPERGSWRPLVYQGRTVGAVLRTRANVRPLFVSSGHLVCLDDAIRFVLEFCNGYRLPEPLREADRVSRATGF
ncbi:MAG: endonuclease V [candidate division WOR-3 bacterium]